MRGNTVTMLLAKGSIARAGGLFQYDYGQRLILNGVELPVAYEVHFSNKERGESKTSIGDSTGVDIPDEYLQTGENIHVWLYLHEGEDDGETEYHGIIAVQKRAKPLNAAPTPVQQDVITQTIAALDDAVEEVEGIAEEIPNTIDTALQEARDSGEFDGFSPTANVVKEGHVATITITDKDGTTTATVEDGSAVMIDDNAGAGVKDKTWSADKITAAIGDINSFDIEIVQTLPQTGDEHTIYFVPKTGGHGDSYDEYLYLNGQWEMIGTTDVDVSTKADKTDTVLLTTLSRGRRSGTTVGGNSFAFGQDVTASANNTHAEGYNSRATGAGAHAEGGNTTASGQYSHAEGENATASGLRSHAEGYITTASGSYSHAEGYGAVGTGALGKADHAEGYQTIANSGGGASVYAAHAEGKNTTASNNAAHAEGEGAMASGTASHAEGSGTSATAAGSHAEGTSTQATGSQSHSEGNSSVASGESAHSEGNSTTASGSYAHAEGNSTTASGIGSHAEGVSVSGKGAFGQADHSEGYHTTANSGTGDKYGAHAEGRLTTASNNAAHAEGWSSTASGSCSHAEGSNTTASGGGSHAEGSVTTASGAGAHSEGDHTVASGQHSHAQGGYTEASGMYSFAAGNGTIANASGSFVFGMHNVPDVLEYPEWVSGTHYYVGNKVRHLNQMAWPNPIWENKECIEENSDTYFTAQKWKSAESPYNYTHLEIVGNGTINNKSNARSLDKYGTERLKGDLYVNCNADSSGGHKVIAEPATEGTSGQVLTTDGQGGRSWTTVQGGGNIIDDTAGVGDTDKTYSADKLATDHSSLLNAINVLKPAATASDVGKALIVKTVADGEPTSFEYGESGGGSIDPQDIAEAVDAWCDENITNPSNPPLDRSLSISSAAAPADMVGVINDYLKIPTSKHFEGTSSGSWSLTSIGEMTLKNGVTYNFKYSVPVSGTTIYIYLRNEDNTNIKQESISSTSTERTFTYTCSEANKLVKFAFQVGVSTATTVSVDVTSDEESLIDELLIHRLNLTGWENKGIVPTTGVIEDNQKRLHTIIPQCAKSCLCDTGYSFAVFAWNGGTFLGWFDGTSWSKDNLVTRTDELDLTGFANYELHAVFVNATIVGNATNIDVSENVHFKVKSQTDATLLNPGVPADAKATGDAIPVVDNTLSVAGAAADAKATGDSIGFITDSFEGMIPEEITVFSNGYLKTNVDTVDVNNPSSTTGYDQYRFAIVQCNPGDEFTVIGKYVGSVADLYTFTDSSYNVIERSEQVGTVKTYYPKAPSGSAYVIFQKNRYAQNQFWKGIALSTKIGQIENAVSNIEDNLPGYDSPAYYKSDDSQNLVSTYSGVISLYDSLVTANPDYITKNTLTSDQFTNYEYVFSMGNRNAISGERQQDQESEKPVVLIMSGVHGDERCSVMGLYLFAKALCENPTMSEIRNSLIIKMIPIVTPTAYNSNSRLNSNSVNINRNFDANWVQTEQGSNYSGASAADQDETQVVQNWMDANDDAVLMIDWHNSGYENEISYLATCIADGFATNTKKGYFYGIDRITSHWINDRNIEIDGTIFGYTGVDANSGTSCAYAKKISLPGCLVETSWQVGDYDKDTPQTIGVNAEAFCALIKGINKKYIET